MQSTTAAAETFSKKISLWIKKLQTYTKACPGIKCRSRKAAALMIKHRAANLTYSESLTKFGQFPFSEHGHLTRCDSGFERAICS